MDKVTTKLGSYALQGELFSLSPIESKPIEVSFTAPDLSSQGGLLLLREQEFQTGFLHRLSSTIEERRTPYLIKHNNYEMICQRVFQIAGGYEDADDCDRLRNDSILKLCSGRHTQADALCSQPSMSRLENRISMRELYHLGLFFIREFIDSYAQAPEEIILDLDDTSSNAYGAQQGTLFNNYYNEYCFMPLLIFEGISGKMILPLLRPGRRNKALNVFGILRRLIAILHQAWPKTNIIVRGDGHFASKDFMDWQTDKPYVNFIFGLGGNTALYAHTKAKAEMLAKAYKENKEDKQIFLSFMYKASSWRHEQRVVAKIEVNENGVNTRFITTSFQHSNSKFLYKGVYCDRGNMELLVKELKTYLKADRMSCHLFRANQFRLFLHAAAYVMLHGLKTEVFSHTSLQDVTIQTFREKVLLSAVHIREIKTKIRIEFTYKHPHKEEIALAFRRYAHCRRTA